MRAVIKTVWLKAPPKNPFFIFLLLHKFDAEEAFGKMHPCRSIVTMDLPAYRNSEALRATLKEAFALLISNLSSRASQPIAM